MHQSSCAGVYLSMVTPLQAVGIRAASRGSKVIDISAACKVGDCMRNIAEDSAAISLGII